MPSLQKILRPITSYAEMSQKLKMVPPKLPYVNTNRDFAKSPIRWHKRWASYCAHSILHNLHRFDFSDEFVFTRMRHRHHIRLLLESFLFQYSTHNAFRTTPLIDFDWAKAHFIEFAFYAVEHEDASSHLFRSLFYELHGFSGCSRLIQDEIAFALVDA